ncbi:MAG: hypothetical protein K2R93_12205 [Gemmatimonadaceae bacterium]|nr:hypothetical protein [Gemmatimonadaceae bacterium]
MNRIDVMRLLDQASLILLVATSVRFGKAYAASDFNLAAICMVVAIGCGFACEKISTHRDKLVREGAR